MRSKKSHGKAKHGARSPEWSTWWGMLSRCHSETHVSYKNYGARGITVCDEWRESFLQFYADMGNKPSQKHTLERIDNSRGYEPGNVKWALPEEQWYNKRTNRNITFNGKTQALNQWAKELGINRSTIYYRLKHGWSVEKTLTTH